MRAFIVNPQGEIIGALDVKGDCRVIVRDHETFARDGHSEFFRRSIPVVVHLFDNVTLGDLSHLEARGFGGYKLKV